MSYCSVVIVSSRLGPRAGERLTRCPVALLRTEFGGDSGVGSIGTTVSRLRRKRCSVILVVGTSGMISAGFLRIIGGACTDNSGTVRARHVCRREPDGIDVLGTVASRVGGSVLHTKRIGLKLSTSLGNSKATVSFA